MGRIIRPERAISDIDGLADYIAIDNLDAAIKFLDDLEYKLKLLSDFPGMGAKRFDFAPGIRSFPFGKYFILYRPMPDGIELATVVYGALSYRRIRRLLKP
jgi:toxin ParE1/3/4